jgi:hypothetical protein
MSGLDDLTLNRRNIKNAIRRLQNSISDAEIDVNVLETSLESISDLFKEYDAVQFKIEKLQLKKKDADEAQLAEESDKERTWPRIVGLYKFKTFATTYFYREIWRMVYLLRII